MNSYTLRFHNIDLEQRFIQQQQQESKKVYITYQPLLIISMLTISIVQLIQGEIILGFSKATLSIALFAQLIFVWRYNPRYIRHTFPINNIIITCQAIQEHLIAINIEQVLFYEVLLIIINIQLLRGCSLLTNITQALVIIIIRITLISIQFGFQPIILLVTIFYLYQIYLEQIQQKLKRKLFLISEEQSQQDMILNYALQDSYLSCQFNTNSFTFELISYNQITEHKLNISNQLEFKEFMRSATIAQKPVQKSSNSKELNQLGTFLYESFVVKNQDEVQHLQQFEIIYNRGNVKTNLTVRCYFYSILQQQFALIISDNHNIPSNRQVDPIQTYEITLYKSQLKKIQKRANNQQQLIMQFAYIFGTQSQLKQYYISFQSLLVSTCKNNLILDAISIYYLKKSQVPPLEKINFNDFIRSIKEIIEVVAKQFRVEFEIQNKVKEDVILFSKRNILNFVLLSILYLTISQQQSKHVIVQIRLNAQSIIIFTILIDGDINLQFLRSNSFIKRQIYKSLNFISPKAEISSIYNYMLSSRKCIYILEYSLAHSIVLNLLGFAINLTILQFQLSM